MTGRYARVEAISPRPEGFYRFAVRMKADAPVRVSVLALGAGDMFSVGTAWEQYTIDIPEQDGNTIDFCPLGDTTVYVEKLQLTYGKGAYEWRPAAEDNADFEWVCLARDEATIANIRDIVSYTTYYLTQAEGLPEPAKPTTYPPGSDWTDTEPMNGAYSARARVTGTGITGATVSAPQFAEAVGGGPGAAGVHRLSYDGSWWRYNGENVDLRDYGIMTTGTAMPGDTIAVTLTYDTSLAVYTCPVTVYSDGSFAWGDVSRSAAFDAARAAINTSTAYETVVEQLLDSWTATVRATTVNDDTGETVSDLLGRIQVTESTISNLIEETRAADEGLEERLSSLQIQTAQDITNVFTEAKNYVKDTKEYVDEAVAWQRFSADGIEQGRIGSPFKSVLNNEELGFYENTTKVAYINNNKFMITNGEIVQALTIGNFELTSSNDGLGIVYRGGGGS